MKKLLLLLPVLLLLAGCWKDETPIVEESPFVFWSGEVIESTWVMETWLDENFTWDIDHPIPANEMSFWELSDTYPENTITLEYPMQPKQSAGDYESNSQTLRNYMFANMQDITLPTAIKSWYLYIKLRQPIKDKSNLILNAFDGVYGRLRRENAFENKNNQEFIFTLDNIDTREWTTKNRLTKAGKTFQVGWFVGTFDGNGIESIKISRY